MRKQQYVDPSATHPIQVVARRTGLSADVIRAWEKRYAAVSPRRNQSSSQRLYSDADVERLTLLRRVTLGGRRIGDVARLPDDELAGLARADQAAVQQLDGETAQPVVKSVRTHFDACLASVRRLDSRALESALANASVALSTPVFLEDVLSTLLNHIGDQWRNGEMRLCHEHMATAAVRSFLGPQSTANNMNGAGPSAIVTTPVGQGHELGALMVAVSAASSGWNVVYLGQRTPAEEIAFAAEETGARAVALSLSFPADDPLLPAELRRLRRCLSNEVALLVGGAAVNAYRAVLDEIDAQCPANLDAFRTTLDQIRRG